MAIKKLVLIRTNDMNSRLIAESPLKPFVKGDAHPVSPTDQKAWPTEAGLSHYAFELDGMKLKDWKSVKEWNESPATVPALVIDLLGTGVHDTLATLGLRINPEA
jgi:hypothetical protein